MPKAHSPNAILVPADRSAFSALALLREGYRFIGNRCRQYGTTVFRMRLLGRPMICLRGAAAATLFYDESRFTRDGVLPRRVRRSLFGEGGVQTLDGAAHRHRKALFLSVMSAASIARFESFLRRVCDEDAARWQAAGWVVLFRSSAELLCRAACDWVGLSLSEAERPRRARQMIAMIDAFGAAGPRHWRGRWARASVERWVEAQVRDLRAGTYAAPPDSPLARFSAHVGLDGRPLDARAVAVELVNLVRPTVAVAYFVAFAALALHRFPRERQALAHGDPLALEAFVHELRRFYPFAPFLGARVRYTFVWRGTRFTQGQMVLLDLFGTNHDESRWPDAEQFRSARFRDLAPGAYDFVPQGGGEVATGHRCPGEWLTIAALKILVDLLARRLDYRLPAQDLRYSLRRMPTFPRSGVVLAGVRVRPAELALPQPQSQSTVGAL